MSDKQTAIEFLYSLAAGLKISLDMGIEYKPSENVVSGLKNAAWLLSQQRPQAVELRPGAVYAVIADRPIFAEEYQRLAEHFNELHEETGIKLVIFDGMHIQTTESVR